MGFAQLKYLYEALLSLSLNGPPVQDASLGYSCGFISLFRDYDSDALILFFNLYKVVLLSFCLMFFFSLIHRWHQPWMNVNDN